MKKWCCLLAFAAVGLGAAVIEAESGKLTPDRAAAVALDSAIIAATMALLFR